MGSVGEGLRGEQLEDEPVLVGRAGSPSQRRKEEPAGSFGPKPTEPSRRPGTNHLNPTGTCHSSAPRSVATRSIVELETGVLPIRMRGGPVRAPP